MHKLSAADLEEKTMVSTVVVVYNMHTKSHINKGYKVVSFAILEKLINFSYIMLKKFPMRYGKINTKIIAFVNLYFCIEKAKKEKLL